MTIYDDRWHRVTMSTGLCRQVYDDRWHRVTIHDDRSRCLVCMLLQRVSPPEPKVMHAVPAARGGPAEPGLWVLRRTGCVRDKYILTKGCGLRARRCLRRQCVCLLVQPPVCVSVCAQGGKHGCSSVQWCRYAQAAVARA